MKKLTSLVVFLFLVPFSINAQQEEAIIKDIIIQLFDGMRNADSASVIKSFAPQAIMQTIAVNKEGKTMVREELVSNFASSVGKQEKGFLDEQITIETIKVDRSLAIVWTPYRFFYKGNFSHCGVNSFTLVKLDGVWKINYIIDTRRKSDCN